MIKHEENIYIICLALTHNKMYIYGENSILIRRFEYKKIAELCGKPVCMSEDGLSLVFQKSDSSSEIFIVGISIDGLKVIKKVNIKNSV